MRFPLANPCKPFPSVLIALIVALTLLFSGWTCRAMFGFKSCQGVGPQPQITSLSPNPIPSNTDSVLLTVNGSGFTPQSRIMWNGNALETTFKDSHHIEATITQQSFESLGGSAGSSVQISVSSQPSAADLGCPNSGNSATLVLFIS